MGREFQRWCVALAAAIAVAGLGLVLAGCGDEEAGSEQPPDGGSQGAAQFKRLGPEARGRERARIVAGFDAYMNALAAGDYRAACDHLTRRARDLLARAGSEQGGGGCPRALAGSQGFARRAAGREIEKVQVDAGTAQVIFSVPGAEPDRVWMHREDGEWKAGLPSPASSPDS